MTFSKAVKTCLVDKYATFSGRASRSEFWWYSLFPFLLYLLLFILLPFDNELFVWIYLFISILFILPNLAVTIRRFHDTGRSGWWILIQLIPYLGSIIFLVLLCLPSEANNKYGPKSE